MKLLENQAVVFLESRAGLLQRINLIESNETASSLCRISRRFRLETDRLVIYFPLPLAPVSSHLTELPRIVQSSLLDA